MLTALLLGLREVLDLAVPLGPDAAMWGLGAVEWLGIPPLYPALLATLAPLAHPWYTGGLVSCAAYAGVAVLLWRLARPSVLVLLVPDLWIQALHLQPDALTQLLLLAVLAAGFHWEDTGRSWPMVVAAVLLAATREHGLVVLPAVGLVLVGRRSPKVAIGLAVAGTTGILLSASLLPERLAMPLATTAFASEAPPWAAIVGGAWASPLENQGRLWLHMLAEHGDHWLILVLGALGFYRRGRLTGLVVLAPALALLLFFGQARHTAVLLPVAAVGVALGRSRLLTVLGALTLLVTLRETPRHADALRAGAETQHRLQDLTVWMAEQPGTWALGGLDNTPNLYLGWPRHAAEFDPCSPRFSAAEWHTMWIGPKLPAPLERAYERDGMEVWRLPGEGCVGVEVTGPLYLREPVAAEAGACTAPTPGSCDTRSPIIKEETP